MAKGIGQQVGNYRLVSLLGSGGFADVYLGQHVHLTNRQVAIKILHDRLYGKYEAQFLREAQTIAMLEHRHIVHILDYGIDDTPYLIMEYAQKGTLRDIYPRGSIIPLQEIVSLLQQVATALQHAHEQR